MRKVLIICFDCVEKIGTSKAINIINGEGIELHAFCTRCGKKVSIGDLKPDNIEQLEQVYW